MAWLARSAAGDELTRYHVEAGIAWEHCRAPTFADTDWRRIAELYGMQLYVHDHHFAVANLVHHDVAVLEARRAIGAEAEKFGGVSIYSNERGRVDGKPIKK